MNILKHLMTGPEGNSEFVSRESQCFPRWNIEIRGKQNSLLYCWRFSRYSAPIHWLVYCHMTSNNETVSRQMP